MIKLDDSKLKRTTGASNPPLLTSPYWGSAADLLRKVERNLADGSKAEAGIAVLIPGKSPLGILKKDLMAVSAIQAGLSKLAHRLAELAEQESKIAEEIELQYAEARGRRDGRKAIRESISNFENRFQAMLERAEQAHRDDVRSGRFLREYKDEQPRERAERFSRKV